MPTKKQKRRNQKARRHEYEYVYLDDEGNEVPVEPTELRAEKNGQRESKPRKSSSGKQPAGRGDGCAQEHRAPVVAAFRSARAPLRPGAGGGDDPAQQGPAARAAGLPRGLPDRVLHPVQLLHRLVRLPRVPEAPEPARQREGPLASRPSCRRGSGLRPATARTRAGSERPCQWRSIAARLRRRRRTSPLRPRSSRLLTRRGRSRRPRTRARVPSSGGRRAPVRDRAR